MANYVITDQKTFMSDCSKDYSSLYSDENVENEQRKIELRLNKIERLKP